jgi:hypothetical protein
MRTEDLGFKMDESLPFDIVDDMAIYMRNDPVFYRKHYLPVMFKMADMHNSNKEFDGESMLGPVIDKGVASYCQKFIQDKRPNELMNSDDRKDLIHKLYSEEMTQIKRGEYK